MDRDLKQMASFLATDEVPETIFGIPVVASEDQYTEEDLQFFEEHPEAGGYYDMGEGTPDDGTEEGAPVQKDDPLPAMDPQLQHDVLAWADRQMTEDPMRFSKSGVLERTDHTPGFPANTMKCNGFVAQAFNTQDGYHDVYPVNMKTGGLHLAAEWVYAGDKKWQKPIPKGWIEVPLGQQQAGDIVAAVSSDWKPGRSGHIGIVGSDRKSSYNARVNEGLQLTEFPFKPTKMKDGSTVNWKDIRVFRYVQPSKTKGKKGAR